MISSRKLNANRINARASTGPKSAQGKARSAANARRHGLTVPIQGDRDLADRAQALVRLFAGDAPSLEVLKLATTAADAQIHIDRIRQAARDLMSAAGTDQPPRQIQTLADYERRAISRRNRAFQDITCQQLLEGVIAKTAQP